MRANRLREIWAAGRPVVNGWMNMPGALAAEVMASMGWDGLTIDTQHGIIGYSEMVAMLQAISTTEVTPLVRVSWNNPGEIMKALDAGAYGIICPMVSTAQQCRDFVGACRYAPRGYRSSGPTRARIYGGADYHAHADDAVLAIAMIETAEALENLEAIVATPELDAVYIGPSDLSLATGGPPGQDSQDPAHLARFDRIVAAAHAHGVKAGIHTASPEYARQMLARGFDLVTVSGDMRYLMSGVRDVRAMREHIEGRK